MHSANFTAFSRAVLAVRALPELLAVPVSEGAFEPQPRADQADQGDQHKGGQGPQFLLMFAPYMRGLR
jgi:hypothetical protein